MSLVKCPKCGGSVSSTASECVHCGCQFIVCPECGAICAKGVQTCAKCGYRFSFHAADQKQTESPQSPQNDSKKLLNKKLLNRVTADNTLQNRTKKAGVILVVLSSLLFVIWVIILIAWIKSDPLEALAKYDGTKQLCQMLIVLSALIQAGCWVVRLCQASIITRCAKWIRQNKINFKDYLFSIRDANDRKTRSVYERMKAAACYSEDISAKNLFIAGEILSVLIQASLNVASAVLFNLLVEKAMTAYLTSQSLDLLTILIPIFVGVVICLVLFALPWLVIIIIQKQREKQWAKKNNL